MQGVDELSGERFIRITECRNILREFDPDHQAEAANFRQHGWKFFCDTFETFLEIGADFSRVFIKALATDHLEDFEANGATERRATKRCSVGAGPKQVSVGLAHPKGADRKA